MKRRFFLILTVLSLLLSLVMIIRLKTIDTTLSISSSLSALQGDEAIKHLKEHHGLHGSLQEAAKAARYGFYKEPKQKADWTANNPAQRFRASLTLDGLQVITKSDGRRNHSLGMKLRSAGYGDKQIAVRGGSLTTNGSNAEIHYELPQSPQSAITEWYQNMATGLEQGFTIKSAPGERRDGEMLRVSLALDSDLKAEVMKGGQALEFRNDAEQRVLLYDHLEVIDGGGESSKLECR